MFIGKEASPVEPAKHFLALYHRMRLTVYRRLLHRTGRLSAADAIAADVIYLLERPTLTQFAGEMGISQPSAPTGSMSWPKRA